MPNGTKNLIQNQGLSQEEVKEVNRKGGKKSGEVRRARKLMKEQMSMLLSLPVKDEETKNALKKLGIEKMEMDNQMALMVVLYKQALTGDLAYVEKVQEIVGDLVQKKPETEVTINNNSVNPFEGLTVDELKKLAGVDVKDE